MKSTVLLSLSVVGVALAADAPAPPPSADITAAVRDYATYRKMLEEPKSISAGAEMLCRSIPDDKQYGPHSRNYVQHFRNPVAAEAGEGKIWPVGSILVKQKLRGDPAAKPTTAPPAIHAIAGMVKRPAGTHPKSGDWEFFWSVGEKTTTTKLESCAGCHSGAARDYVFTSFPGKKAN